MQATSTSGGYLGGYLSNLRSMSDWVGLCGKRAIDSGKDAGDITKHGLFTMENLRSVRDQNNRWEAQTPNNTSFNQLLSDISGREADHVFEIEPKPISKFEVLEQIHSFVRDVQESGMTMSTWLDQQINPIRDTLSKFRDNIMRNYNGAKKILQAQTT